MANATSSDSNPLDSEIASLPASMRSALVSGYRLAATLDEGEWRRAVESVIRDAERTGGTFDLETLAETLSIPERDARRVLSGISATVAVLTQTGASADEFVDLAKKGTLPEASVRAASIASELIVTAREELERSFARRRLAAAVLPSLDSFEVTVDLRLKIADGRVEDFVPVALVHIDSDAVDHELWLQLTLDDVSSMIKKLEDARDQMGIAARLTVQPS
jgi:hypothetical protein